MVVRKANNRITPNLWDVNNILHLTAKPIIITGTLETIVVIYTGFIPLRVMNSRGWDCNLSLKNSYPRTNLPRLCLGTAGVKFNWEHYK
ncbi:MAG: hypothetical protein DRP65_03795 [Planctomycetota bacterium]|nr:MAG: hypothetical protein DRP65_03795 [Planctomycetota bacterium]